MTGLSVNDAVNVAVQLALSAAQGRNFGNLLIQGDSSVIDTSERMRLYTSLAAMAADGFSGTAPEYLAATLFFDQSPTPAQVYVGRWASGATSGLLRGGVLSASAQALANFTAVTNGGIGITIDGTSHNLTGLNFSGAANLNAVAAIVTTALTGSGTVTWDSANSRFIVTSASTGTSSSVPFATVGAGTDISALMALATGEGGYIVAGVNAETALAGVQALADKSADWYGLQMATTVGLAQSDILAIAGFIEAATVTRIYGVTTTNAAALDSTSTTDTAYVIKQGNFKRTFCQYSSTKHASASIFGRAFTVDFTGINTTITLKFKQEPGVTAETITESQAAALAAKNCNVFVNYNNGAAIVQQGVMSNGYYFDEVHGTDWMQNDLQTAAFNALVELPKIPQSDAGVNQLIAVLASQCDQAVANGLLAPGVWGGPPVGPLDTGDTLTKGYLVYAPPVATQSAADRAKRVTPLIQIPCKLAGAIHVANILVSVNR